MMQTTVVKKLAREYQDLNGTYYDVLSHPPTPLEFARIVKISRPVLIKDHPCPLDTDVFTDKRLKEILGDKEVSIALTPDGNADSITISPGGEEFFIEPHVERMTLNEFFRRLDLKASEEVSYLQSQNGNVHSDSPLDVDPDGKGKVETEFEELKGYVPRDFNWAVGVFGSCADAVNIWIGDEKSVTSVHSDPYENIYTVIRGSKHFLLFPPTEGWCLQERMYHSAKYTRSQTGTLVLTPNSPTEKIRWSSLNLSYSDTSSDPPYSAPIRISVNAGETLYLPVGWWHHVSQSTATDTNLNVDAKRGKGRCIALNWWYDTEMRGMSWVWLTFLRDLGFAGRNDDDEEPERQLDLVRGLKRQPE